MGSRKTETEKDAELWVVSGAPWKSLPPTWELLTLPFFARDTATVARELLGTYLVSFLPEGIVAGRVVETEAYLGESDPACHSARGKTARNAVMFGPAGRVYVYQIYGMHFCFNVTTEGPEVAAAVLLRALEPVAGVEVMQKRRGTLLLSKLCNGPANLVQALGITRALNEESVVTGPVRFYREQGKKAALEIVVTPRVGISQGKEPLLRFYLKGNHFVSKK